LADAIWIIVSQIVISSVQRPEDRLSFFVAALGLPSAVKDLHSYGGGASWRDA
jgi:hypothetical protein